MADTINKTLHLPVQWRKRAEQRCLAAGARLTPARLTTYAALLTSDRPLTAYELIALLEREQGRKMAPPSIYRHLDFLIRVGLVHRLETTQSYHPCDHPEHPHESQYLLCSHCGRVDEVESKQLSELLDRLASQHGFQPEHAVVEVKGFCGACAVRRLVDTGDHHRRD